MNLRSLMSHHAGQAFCKWMVVAIAIGFPSIGIAQDSQGADGTFHQVGIKECAACHDAPSQIYQTLGITQFVRLKESSEYRADRHSKAYELIDPAKNPRTKAMLEKLNLANDPIQFQNQCLTCHAGLNDVAPMANANGSVAAKAQAVNPSQFQFGIQCESCHGNASQWIQWENHQQSTWRSKSPEEKLAMGMKNLASPTECAEVCASCHLGDIKKSRFVTHAMYAAGHPPLPPFEFQSFKNAMKSHWTPLEAKPTFADEEKYFQANFKTDSPAEFKKARKGSLTQTQASLVGSVIAQQMGTQLVLDASEKPELWGDYALYDCMACHHELNKPARRAIVAGRTPGRPFPAQWWTLEEYKLLKLESIHLPIAESVRDIFNNTPFGNAKQMQSQKGAITAALKHGRNACKEFEKKNFDRNGAKEWLTELSDSRASTLFDYWNARQTGWLVRIALLEQKANDPSVVSEIAKLNKELQLDLMASIDVQYEEQMKGGLDQARNFKYEEVGASIKRLIEKLGPN